ncbi:cell division septum initiation protein DivIVA [Aequitasia blattaphilus]|uniref:Uncharacterized protein n=1 Tax=Aequitasia blattaphilus TaxID=2949332 RepID=A0ABT1EE67_9FIRM|nr:hypothetical protein [Aequitasia blattaphilus]MCP1103232.1 hypothetical protein [Aequitasia blattaphilus]MCR8615872.1 hypothetical protein [Aequitasia blattaphilus]
MSFSLKDKGKEELLDIIRAVEEENHKLRKENMQLEKKVKESEAEILEKDMEMEKLRKHWKESGNLAEFSVKVNGVLEAAQKAAEDYINVNKGLEQRKKREAEEIIAQAMRRREKIISEAQAEAKKIQKLNLATIQNLQREAEKILNSVINQLGESREESESKNESSNKVAI